MRRTQHRLKTSHVVYLSASCARALISNVSVRAAGLACVTRVVNAMEREKEIQG